MRTFEDRRGRKWELEITVGSVKRVRDLLDIDMTDLGEEGLLRNIALDPEKLVDMFWVLLKGQINKYKKSGDEPLKIQFNDDEAIEIQFADGFVGDTIEKATLAFIEALIEFFPSEAKRKTARAIFAKTNNLVTEGLKLIQENVENLDEMAILKEAFDQPT